MKKFLTLILAVCAVGLSSCKIDGLKDLISLENTTWIGTLSPREGINVNIEIKFAATTFTTKATDQAGEVQNTSGTYSYIAPILTMQPSGSTAAINGRINGNELSYKSADQTVVLTKQ